jgi:hypothetical protein
MTLNRSNIIIVSHRRSGTHLLIDLIVNNFSYDYIDKNYIDFKSFHSDKHDDMYVFENLMNKGSKITFTHSQNFKDYLKYKHRKEDNEKLNNFFKNSKVIFLTRDMRDTVSSIYNRPKNKKYKNFYDFYKNYDFDDCELINESYENISECLMQYYRNWIGVFTAKELLDLDMEIVSYEDIIIDYNSVVGKLNKFLNQKIKTIKDVRHIKNKKLKYSSNDFYKGTIGDWKTTIDAQTAQKMFTEHTNNMNNIDCFYHDIKLHEYHIPEKEKYNLNKDWVQEDIKITKKLNLPRANCPVDISKRYEECSHQHGDPRYMHKVFFYDKYVLKFIYPCKVHLDKKTFNTISPVQSKKILHTIYKTNDILYKSGIVPKLYYAGRHKGVVFAVQELADQMVSGYYNFHPKLGDWSWVLNINSLFPKLVKMFNTACHYNIVLTDLINPYNISYKEGIVKYFDLDGIKSFSSKEKMLNSQEYQNVYKILNKLDILWQKKYNYSIMAL